MSPVTGNAVNRLGMPTHAIMGGQNACERYTLQAEHRHTPGYETGTMELYPEKPPYFPSMPVNPANG